MSVVQTAEPVIMSFTDNAAEKVHSLISEEGNDNLKLRVFVTGGGCSGFQYVFSIDNNAQEDDLKFQNIIIDKNSAKLLKGSEVDYVSELIGDSFKISNPQSKSSCGCGVSFSL